MDPFSRLPTEITQIILSFLSTKEAIQKSILSKRFLQACSTIQDLDFTDDKDFSRLYPTEATVKSDSCFLNVVEHTLTRYHEQSIPITSFRLYTLVNDNIANILEQCIRKAHEHRVEKVWLDLYFFRTVTLSTSLLQAIFALEQLLVLKLSCCYLVKFDGIVNCSPLRILKLVSVKTDEKTLQKVFSFCPLIEELLIYACLGLKTIQVANLLNLKRLRALTVINQMVYVKAESLELIDYQAHVPVPYLLSIGSTQNLKEISLSCRNITENQLHNLIAEFHALENLILTRCDEIRKINVSSHSLSFIRLDSCVRLMEVNIVDAPNLNQFDLVGVEIPLLSFPSEGSGKRKSRLALHLHHLEEASLFLKLSELLMKLKQSDDILLYIKSREINFDTSTIGKLRDSVPEFEELFISVFSQSSTYSTLMDGLLWSFSAKILCVKCYSRDDNFLKYLCKELLVEHDPNNSTGSGHWRNYFKRAKFEGRDDEWRPLHSWKCRTDALQNLEKNFILKLSST